MIIIRTAAAATIVVAIYISLPFAAVVSGNELYEEDRVAEYHKRKYKWPPLETEYVPDTPGWRAIHQRRLNQTAHLQNRDSTYNAYMNVIHSALMVPNFTEFGWGLTKAPKSLVYALLENLMNGLEHADDLPVEEPEYYDDYSSDDSEDEDNEGEEAGEGKNEIRIKKDDENPIDLPLMIPNEHLNIRALKELLPIHEAWAGVKLTGNNAYGLRVYRNHSNLQMHIDESSTHIISSILHVGHDPEGEPWPLVIEDLLGNTHEVYLETGEKMENHFALLFAWKEHSVYKLTTVPLILCRVFVSGDMLLYESSKCFHGRPKRYNGRWYSSLFTHYYPEDWDAEQVNLETHYRVPPTWDVEPNDDDEETVEGFDKLVVTETSFKEPDCEHEWCAMKNTIKSKSPADLKFGQVVSTDGIIKSLGLDKEVDPKEGDEL